MGVRIYVGNLPFKTVDGDLEQFFSKYGSVISADVIRYKKSKRSKGYAFVVMEDTAAEKAIDSLHKIKYEGRVLKVKEAYERSNFPSEGEPEAVGSRY